MYVDKVAERINSTAIAANTFAPASSKEENTKGADANFL